MPDNDLVWIPGQTATVGCDDHYAEVGPGREENAEWACRELPTEAECEITARGGIAHAAYTRGNEPETRGQRLANYWHGEFPYLPIPATAIPQR